MNKLNKIVIASLVIVSVAVYPTIVYPNDQSHNNGIINFIYRIIGDLSILLVLSVIISSILSLIPLKGKTFLNKLKMIIPGITLIVLIASSLILLFHETIKFNEVKIPTTLNCRNMKQGQFIYKDLEIERTLDKQLEIDIKTNTTKEYQINWKSDCEYELIGIKNTTKKFKVKIVKINDFGHKVYVSDLDKNIAQLIEMKNK